MRSLRVFASSFLLAASVTSVAVAPVAAQEPPPPEPSMTVDPATGAPGDVVHLIGTGCAPPDTSIYLLLVRPATEDTSLGSGAAGTVTTDSAGSFDAQVSVPYLIRFAPNFLALGLIEPGDYQFAALDPANPFQILCPTPFVVTAAPTLALVASPTSGPAGTTVTMSGSCFITVIFSSWHAEIDGTMVPGSDVHDYVSTGVDPATGLDTWEAKIVLPTDLAPGTTVTFVGSCGQVHYVPATFKVPTVAAAPAEQAQAVASAPVFTG